MTGANHPKLEPIARLYTESLAKHGTAPQGVGWHDHESHRLRFDKLACVLEEPGGPITINDLGCGYGAFYEYLRARRVEVSLFRGYDISPAMLAEARRLMGVGPVELIEGAAIEKDADYSFASGIFNVRQECSEDSWLAHILGTLDNMNAHSRRGFAFNLLTSYVDWREPHLFYGDPRFFFDHCKRNYSRSVALLHDYPLWEWTILVRK